MLPHSELASNYAKGFTFVPVRDMGLQEKLEPSGDSLSNEVFRLQVLPATSFHGQTVVLFAAGIAGSAEPNGPMRVAWLDEPQVVCIMELRSTVALADIMDVEALSEPIEWAVRKLAERELANAQAVIEKLHPKEEEDA